MRVKIVTQDLPEYERVIKTYQTAFPKNEKLPVWFLMAMARKKEVDFYAFFDQEEFCGFAYLIHQNKTTFVYYLAIEESKQSKGYGKKILDWICKEFPENTVMLNIEQVAERFENYPQRVRRQEFYFRNGFKAADYIFNEDGDTYDILYKGNYFSKEDYLKVMKMFSFDTHSSKLERTYKQKSS
ncbi:acetyltransferase, GNAT family [Enterococcus faecalis 13-SD-W-01]|nr:acetyltransferase, GNAT family [Enterococcus faecalis 13-SD-W-01]